MPLKALGITETAISKPNLYLTDCPTETTQDPLNSKPQKYFLGPDRNHPEQPCFGTFANDLPGIALRASQHKTVLSNSEDNRSSRKF
jgi:hypothetical protein